MDSGSKQKFMALVVGAQLAGIIVVILMCVWMGKLQGGFGWGYKNDLKFNYHPLFMTIGLIYLYGNAMLVYRVFRNENKKLIKVLHMFMQLSALGFAIFALTAVFSAHNDEGNANLYTIHGWIGLITVIMFSLQFVMGFVFYLFPGMSEANKIWYMGSHRFWGVAIFCMALATALLGITENTLFKVRDYKERPPQSYVINFMGIFIIVFGWLVTYIVHKPEYQRETTHSEYTEQLQNE